MHVSRFSLSLSLGPGPNLPAVLSFVGYRARGRAGLHRPSTGCRVDLEAMGDGRNPPSLSSQGGVSLPPFGAGYYMCAYDNKFLCTHFPVLVVVSQTCNGGGGQKAGNATQIRCRFGSPVHTPGTPGGGEGGPTIYLRSWETICVRLRWECSTGGKRCYWTTKRRADRRQTVWVPRLYRWSGSLLLRARCRPQMRHGDGRQKRAFPGGSDASSGRSLEENFIETHVGAPNDDVRADWMPSMRERVRCRTYAHGQRHFYFYFFIRIYFGPNESPLAKCAGFHPRVAFLVVQRG